MTQSSYENASMVQVFKEGTWDVKLSFLVMGLSNLVNNLSRGCSSSSQKLLS